MSFQNQTFDDRDQSLRYSGNWTKDGFWNASNGQNGTLSSSNDPNATVTFTFPVPANAFYYYGMKRSRGGNYSICIDCDPDQPQPEFIDAYDSSDNGKNVPSLLFAHEFGSFAIHNITLENQPDDRGHSGNSQMTVDRFVIRVQGNSTAVSNVTLRLASFVTTSSFSTSITNSPMSPSGFSTTSTPVGAIVGGVIGGVVLIALAVLLCIRQRCLRRQERTLSKPEEGSADPGFSSSQTNLLSSSVTRPQAERPPKSNHRSRKVTTADGATSANRPKRSLPAPEYGYGVGAGLTNMNKLGGISSKSRSGHAEKEKSKPRKTRRAVDVGDESLPRYHETFTGKRESETEKVGYGFSHG
ncbi:hypothetical protein VKT23_006617 [Stygiomarasmius scandens]|uniref:Uncharacterized protein n=1 Tax=Marasmiellus scandens TaxID=2682957 RepID=A0ABR1JQC0_9AGAR